MADVVRFADYERKSRTPDSCEPRNPVDADVIIIRPAPKYLGGGTIIERPTDIPADCKQ